MKQLSLPLEQIGQYHEVVPPLASLHLQAAMLERPEQRIAGNVEVERLAPRYKEYDLKLQEWRLCKM